MNQKRDPSLTLRVKKVRRYIHTSELVDDLKRVAELEGRDNVSIRVYDKLGSFNSSTLITRFGTWSLAVKSAGLRPLKPQKASHTALLENILTVWELLGKQPRFTDMKLGLSEFSRKPYVNAFGSWGNTLILLERYVKSRDVPVLDPLVLRTLPIANGESGDIPSLPRRGQRGGQDCGISEASKGSRDPGLRLRMAVMKRDNFKCVLCGSSPALNPKTVLEIDHIIPWSKGGGTVIENLQTLCSKCNNGKSDE